MSAARGREHCKLRIADCELQIGRTVARQQPRPPVRRLGSLLFPARVRSFVNRWLRRFGLSRPPHRCYRKWISQRVVARGKEYSARVEQGLFSILTPVFDPPPHCLKELAKSILKQDYPAFQWVIVDNGSTDRAVRRILDRLRSDSRVRLVRLPHNEGIVRGTRTALEQASGRYVLPVDHDDRLYPDALRVAASFLQTHGDTALLYSDEDKLAHGKPANPLFKPDWDPALFLNCCYVTHLSVIDREWALQLGAYTDQRAEGCPDWDLYCRFVRAGHVPRHIPEILYSWRMHARSTASPNSYAKPYTLDCQRRLLAEHLRQLGLDGRFEIRPNLLYGEPGVWHPVRKPVLPQPIHVLLLGCRRRESSCVLTALAETAYPLLKVEVLDEPGEPPLRQLRDALESLSESALVAVHEAGCAAENLDWPWEALGLFELNADVAVVGGRVLDEEGKVLSAGEVFGFSGLGDRLGDQLGDRLGRLLIGSPDAGRHQSERGMPFICQHAVDAVSPQFFVTRAGFLRGVLDDRGQAISRSFLHAWLGAAARRQGLRVLYSPHIVVRQIGPPAPETYSHQEQLDFLEHEDLKDARHYSRFLSLRPCRGYRLAAAGERERQRTWR